MKSIPITFITPKSINKHLSHAYQMDICAYTQSVYDLEPYSGIQGHANIYGPLWTLTCTMWTYFLTILYIFPFLFFLQKTLSLPISLTIAWQTFSITTTSCMSSPPYILLFTPHSPVICKDYFPLVYMYKLSRYYTVFHIDLGPIFPQSTSL